MRGTVIGQFAVAGEWGEIVKIAARIDFMSYKLIIEIFSSRLSSKYFEYFSAVHQFLHPDVKCYMTESDSQ